MIKTAPGAGLLGLTPAIATSTPRTPGPPPSLRAAPWDPTSLTYVQGLRICSSLVSSSLTAGPEVFWRLSRTRGTGKEEKPGAGQAGARQSRAGHGKAVSSC